MSAPLQKYVFTKSVDRGGPGMTPEWPGADPALHRFYLVDDVWKVFEPFLEWVIGDEFASDEMKREAQRLLAELEGKT